MTQYVVVKMATKYIVNNELQKVQEIKNETVFENSLVW